MNILTRVIGLASLFICGCGSDALELAPVKGVVLLDEKPVEGASVMFKPIAGGRLASGLTNKNGEFTLTTTTPGDGAIVGDHQVTITLSKTLGKAPTVGEDGLEAGNSDLAPQKVIWIVPERYSKLEESGLQETVPPKTDVLTIKLTSQ